MGSTVRTLRRYAFAIVGLMLWLVLTVPSTAQLFYTDVIGGPGGSHFTDGCGDTQALVAINTLVLYSVNTVGPVCQSLSNTVPQGPLVGLSTWGNPNFTDRDHYSEQLRCPPGMVVEGMHVQVSPAKNTVTSSRVVVNIALVCRNLATGEHGETYYSSKRVGVVPVDYTSNATCGTGAMAVGVSGRYGNVIDGLGLLCRTIAPPPPPQANPPPADNTAPPQPPPPKPNKPPLKINNGD